MSERPKGIEPSPSVWKTEALPLSYGRTAPDPRSGPSVPGPARPDRSSAHRVGVTAYTSPRHGVWRSLVAHSLWERGAVGSNPATPTRAWTLRRARLDSSEASERGAGIRRPPRSTPVKSTVETLGPTRVRLAI